ncbi:MAG TPA: hypothetical protein VJ815_02995 [Acidimicrobiia bacterium]|nr:hypothetical protein [Acidimicrobiia bacterium]
MSTTVFGLVSPILASVLGVPSGGSAWGTAIIAMFFFVVVALIASGVAQDVDRRWLPLTIMAGYGAKLVGSTARYLVLELVYGGRGDASGYHATGIAYADVWRTFQVPSSVERVGTDVVEAITGILYVPYQPNKLGGFFIFASLAFLGQILLYAAFRHSLPARHLKWYAAAIFFWPTIVYWPSSIGKESLMLLWIGVTAYGVARLVSGYNPTWVAVIGLGLFGCGLIRLHMALLLAGALFLALLVAKAPSVRAAQTRRLLLVAGAAAGLALVVALTAQDFGVDLTAAASIDAATDEVGEVFEGVETQTDQGGSAVSGQTVSSVADIPEAILRVIFRPLPNEASTMQLLVASIEGTLLLAITVVRLPWILRNLVRIRRTPYLLFAFFYSGGFIIAFSSILNLGILARQRSQVMPLFLALIVVLARRQVDEPAEPEPVGSPARPVPALASASTLAAPSEP